jgi:hypothetical protein
MRFAIPAFPEPGGPSNRMLSPSCAILKTENSDDVQQTGVLNLPTRSSDK